jgi:hypothetical protein
MMTSKIARINNPHADSLSVPKTVGNGANYQDSTILSFRSTVSKEEQHCSSRDDESPKH